MLMISVCCLEGADRWIEQETRYLLPPQRRNAPAKADTSKQVWHNS
jgi:hypothetical protein